MNHGSIFVPVIRILALKRLNFQTSFRQFSQQLLIKDIQTLKYNHGTIFSGPSTGKGTR